MNNIAHFYKDKPLFGLDIGSDTIKVLQINHNGKKSVVHGYGLIEFNSDTIKDGVIIDHKSLAKSINNLFAHNITGNIDTRRVAMSIPSNKTYTKFMTLPKMKKKDLKQAIYSEVEQYISMPVDDLCIDYSVNQSNEEGYDILLVAVPKAIVESYMKLTELLGLEPVAFESSGLATARLFRQQNATQEIPTVLIDSGSSSVDITIYDSAIIVTGTISGGGQALTDAIAKKLSLSDSEAHIVKVKYGINKSKRQSEIFDAVHPELDRFTKEIRRMMRYHEERSTSGKKIEQIITMGGGANMPGLSGYLTNELRIPVRTSDPWQHIEASKLVSPSSSEKTLFATVAGLALIRPEEIFND
jgi:type IV pilus assembly protein PilM